MKEQELDNDYELLYMYHQQEDAALRLLLQKYHSYILNLIHRMARGKSKATRDELYQLALIKLPEAIHTFRMEKHVAFGSYYHHILKCTFLDHIKKQLRYETHQDEVTMMFGFEICEDEGNYLAQIASDQVSDMMESEQELLKQMMKDRGVVLRKEDYRILWLRLQGYSYKEIANQLHTSAHAVDYLIRKLRYKKDKFD